MSCIAHFEGSKGGNLIPLTQKTTETLKTCIEQWRELFKEPERTVSCDVCLPLVNIGAQIHKSCYQRLTNKKRIVPAKKRHREVSDMP